MKTSIFIIVIIAILLASCTPGIPTQEIAVPTDTQLPVTQIVTDLPTATEAPTKTPSMTPVSCVTLLSPPNGAEIPAIGKVTFSWDPMQEATFYVLNIILPSGIKVSFDTRETFRGQYMEAFSAGGEYQWEVIIQDRKRNEICRSELATFSKPASNLPQPTVDDDNERK